ncbi:pseudouridine synthase [Cryobacterium sp. CG_9.6]|uniref:pseudouridine synthase n=1 Tax=Cryobacterium sp. CG_9.6 TaxID=2760710 RepID=UPI0024758A88|nr:pseudouridine synthase [Cryobacterium sp. CG_9.6]MDH6236670.1 23S rRNA pseudouridine2605 synthase/16S rRNA pseudouridine516 synthase [Cryobacterium sp. CG_9.6]
MTNDHFEFTNNPDAGTNPEAAADGIRLQKVLAAAGVASRRVSEDLITSGRVRVNGKVVTELGRRVHPDTDQVAVDNVAVQLDTTRRYIMLNKPVGVVSSMMDENGRPDLREFTDQFDERLFNVGRLDAQTSGLLILTNDGDMAHVLAHPSFGVMKTYIAKVEGRVSAQTIGMLQTGIELEDGPIKADKARILTSPPGEGVSLVEVRLHSGRNRIVRRMLEAVGHPVIDLVRRQFGPLHLGTLRQGALRELTREELGLLLTVSRQAPSKRPSVDEPAAEQRDDRDDRDDRRDSRDDRDERRDSRDDRRDAR